MVSCQTLGLYTPSTTHSVGSLPLPQMAGLAIPRSVLIDRKRENVEKSSSNLWHIGENYTKGPLRCELLLIFRIAIYYALYLASPPILSYNLPRYSRLGVSQLGTSPFPPSPLFPRWPALSLSPKNSTLLNPSLRIFTLQQTSRPLRNQNGSS